MDTHPDWKLSVGMDHLSGFLALEGGSVREIGRKVFGLAVWICYGHPSRLEALGRYGSSLRLLDWKHPGPSTPTSLGAFDWSMGILYIKSPLKKCLERELGGTCSR
ncbi:hypothetical protein ACLB2K_046386 [Fragaria x ananassa]